MISKHAPKHNPKMRPPFKVRHEPPTLDEAIFAAQGVTDDPEQQVELAAELMALPPGDIRDKVLKAATAKPAVDERVFVQARSGLQRAVVITTNGRSRNRLSSGSVSAPISGVRTREIGERRMQNERGPMGSYSGPRGRFSS